MQTPATLVNPFPPIAALLPQAGAMVLLDEIVRCDERRIACRATSHRNPLHPLAHQGAVPVWAGIEYAAQAMAAHFCLCAGAGRAATMGLLGGLRGVECEAARLDDVDGALLVEAERLAQDGAGSIYAFRLTAESGGRLLIAGRATVVQRVEK